MSILKNMLPVARLEPVRLLLAFAASEGWGRAPHGRELQEDVFVEQEDLSITSPPLPVVLVIHAQGYLQIDRHVFFFACFVFSLTCAEHQLVVCRAFREAVVLD